MAQLRNQIYAGSEILDTKIAGLETLEAQYRRASSTYGSLSDEERRHIDKQYYRILEEQRPLARSVDQWRSYSATWLDKNLGGEAAEEYDSLPKNPYPVGWDRGNRELYNLRLAIESEISKLQSLHDRLHLWVPKDSTAASSAAERPPDAPIFIVHGSDTLRAERIARTVTQATGRQTIILREQASLGRTLIEKFEQHAASASYAIVVLTPDDEGGRKDQRQHNVRARQNVIFEMGYFYGILGRRRVSALLHPGVEKPSDIDGIVYITFDDNGAWKAELYRELEHAHIHVDISRAI